MGGGRGTKKVKRGRVVTCSTAFRFIASLSRSIWDMALFNLAHFVRLSAHAASSSFSLFSDASSTFFFLIFEFWFNSFLIWLEGFDFGRGLGRRDEGHQKVFVG